MAKKIGDYSIGVKYEIDRKSLDDLQNSLNSIQGAAQNSKMNGTLTKELQDAAKMADKVGDILEASFNKDLGTGVQISFKSDNLKYFTEWKMMGVRDYVLGLEPGNCHPDGRNKMRQEGTLKILKPSEKVTYKVEVNMIESLRKFNSIKNK